MSIYSQASLQKTTLTFTSVKAVLMVTECVDAASFENQASPSAFKAEAPKPNRPRQPSVVRDKRSDMCNWCARLGHWEADCRAKASGKPKANEGEVRRAKQYQARKKSGSPVTFPSAHPSTAPSAFLATEPTSQARVTLLDCGASRHMLGDKSAFLDLQPLHDYHIQLGSTTATMSALGQGTAHLTVILSDGTPHSITLSNDLWVPDGHADLISLGALVAKGGRPSFTTTNSLSVHLQGREALHARSENLLWVVKTMPHCALPPQTAMAASVERARQPNYQLWHERLGHRAFGALEKTATMVKGMQLDGEQPVGAVCSGCQLGKGHRDPFPSSPRRASRPFELVHADLFGPTRVPSGKIRFYISRRL